MGVKTQTKIKAVTTLSGIGVTLCAAGLGASFFLFVLSLPQIGIGIWPQSELSVAGLHLSAALCTLGLLITALGHNRMICSYVLTNPLVILPAAIAFISFIFMPFYDLPVRHLTGSPKSGEGLIWWLDWAAITAASILTARILPLKYMIGVIAVIALILNIGLTFSYEYFKAPTAPFYFPDFLALPVISLFVLFQAFFKPKSRMLWLLFYAAIIVLLWLAKNQAAILYGLIGIPVLALLWSSRLTARKKIGLSMAALIAAALCALGLVFTLVMMAGDEGFYRLETIQSVRTALSRGYLIEMALGPLLDNPATLLTGTGWGTYTEHVVRHLPAKEWIDLTIEGRQWDGVTWNHFHSHNIFIETLFSIGLPGLITLCAFILVIPFIAKNSQKLPGTVLAGGWVSVGSFWFLFPLNVPYMAYALGLLARPKRLFRPQKTARRIIMAVLLVTIGAQTFFGYTTAATAVRTNHYGPQSLSPAEAMENCPQEYKDFKAGGLHLSRMMIGRTRALVTFAQQKEASPDKIRQRLDNLNHLYCQSADYIQHNPVSKRLQIAQLIMRGEILLGLPGLDEETVLYYSTEWEDTLKQWLTDMPDRTDQAIPYILWQITRGNEKAASDMAFFIYQEDRHDPVGLWFTGMALLSSPDGAGEGINRMRQALDNGIRRLMPIEKDLIRQLTARSP